MDYIRFCRLKEQTTPRRTLHELIQYTRGVFTAMHSLIAMQTLARAQTEAIGALLDNKQEITTFIKLNLRGTIFTRTISSFDRFPDSLLAIAFRDTSLFQPSIIVDGAYYFDRDPVLFERVITKLYDYGVWEWKESDEPEIVFQELCYWGLAPIEFPQPGQPLKSTPEYIGSALANCFKWTDELTRVCITDDYTLEQYKDNKNDGYYYVPGVYNACRGSPNIVRCQALRHGISLSFQFRCEPAEVINFTESFYEYKSGDLLQAVYVGVDNWKYSSEVVQLQRTPDGLEGSITMDGKVYVVNIIKHPNNKVYKVVVKWPLQKKSIQWPTGYCISIRKSVNDEERKGALPSKDNFYDWGKNIIEAEQYSRKYTEIQCSQVTDTDIFLIHASGKAEAEYCLDTISPNAFQNGEVRSVEVFARNLNYS